MFADTATIDIQAGRGGDGKLSFRHEKYQARGGPDGGDGGRGGDVVFKADHNANTLSRYRTQKLIKADPGSAGGGNRRKGAAGEPAVIKVPVGTAIIELDTGATLADLIEDGQQQIIAKGGRGGYGNAHFVSSTRQAPRLAEPGEPGEKLTVKLELKLVADVGLVGLPNAGKSTLLSVISAARPEIADYPFTTLIPNLGMASHRDHEILVADIPGLIEGASEGKGLGDEFLRHVERTSVIVHLIDAGSDDPVRDYKVIEKELASYSPLLAAKPKLVALSKIDTVDAKQIEKAQKKLAKVAGNCLTFSSQTHTGLTQLLDGVWKLVEPARQAREAEDHEIPVITITDMPDAWRVAQEEDGSWRVQGQRIESFARRTNPDQDDSIDRLRDILGKMGIARELKRRGIVDGAIVRVGAIDLEWTT